MRRKKNRMRKRARGEEGIKGEKKRTRKKNKG